MLRKPVPIGEPVERVEGDRGNWQLELAPIGTRRCGDWPPDGHRDGQCDRDWQCDREGQCDCPKVAVGGSLDYRPHNFATAVAGYCGGRLVYCSGDR